MTRRTINNSPQLYGRIAGVLYLCGLFGEILIAVIWPSLENTTAIAYHIMASEFIFRCGIAGDLIIHITDVPITVISMCC